MPKTIVRGGNVTAGGKRQVYGPVPSRRLGRSLGVDLVPFKTCTYDCIYCQLGRTTNKTIKRAEYVPVSGILQEIAETLSEDIRPDYISLAGSGEPTLNAGLGRLIADIKRLTRIPVAVITNGSLLWMPEVRSELLAADVVLPSLDAGNERLFQEVNRPHSGIAFEAMAEGLIRFTKRFTGEVWLEILLCAGITGNPEQVRELAGWVEKIRPARVQLNTVTRPPAEKSALTVSGEQMHSLKLLFGREVDVMAGEDSATTFSTALRSCGKEEVLDLLRRRPCTPKDVADGLGIHVQEAVKHLEILARSGEIRTIVKDGLNFYVAGDSQ